MIDPLISLAVSMHAQKGVYALLLGSGVSRSAQIPTGWEIMLDLASRLAAASGVTLHSQSSAEWYHRKYGRQLDYSHLLDELTSTPAQRVNLLNQYFEPTKDELEQGIKTPTKAHRSIADLVANGYVRIILTTNFDRLIELAVEDKGLAPAIVASPDAVEGSLPLAHSPITIVKVHGDYKDARLKKTASELSQYDERITKLLDQIFDEYGLIICGWSAQWDHALRAAIERRASRRFPIYWISRGEPSDEAKRLIATCKAIRIDSAGADDFFFDLASKIQALEDLQFTDPMPPAVAAATVKRYLSEDRFRILLVT